MDSKEILVQKQTKKLKDPIPENKFWKNLLAPI